MYEKMTQAGGGSVAGGLASYAAQTYAQPQTAGEARHTEVESENKRLAETVEHLCNVAEMLGERLAPVRRKTGGLNGAKEASVPEPVLCELATITRLRRQSIEHAISVLQTALNELEI